MINLILLLIIGIFCFLIFKNSKKAKLQALENEKLAADFLANNSKADLLACWPMIAGKDACLTF